MTWTPERVEKLKELWADGYSARWIAVEMGLTRSGVIGKVHRLNLEPRKTRFTEKHAARTPKARRQPLQRVSEARTADTAPEQYPPLLMPLMQLDAHHCRFPIGNPGEPDFGFCGVPREGMDPYCAYHMHLCYRPIDERLGKKFQRYHARAA